MEELSNSVSIAVLHRLPIYLKALYDLKKDNVNKISSVGLAEITKFNASVVKKDLSCVLKNDGKPKIGYVVDEMIEDIKHFLGINNTNDAILIGVGKLGQALLGYCGFEAFGLNIVAGFDVDPKIINTEICGKKILSTTKLANLVKRLNIKLAILTLPQEFVQQTANILIEAGIRAIWNFSPHYIQAPVNVVVKNQNLAASLAVLSQQLKYNLEKEI